jgi:hypothetical protein
MQRIADLTEVANTNKHWAALSKYNHFRVQFPDGLERSLLFTDKELQRGLDRANKNQEDLPEIPWLRDFLD